MVDDLHATVRDEGPGLAVAWWESTPADGLGDTQAPRLMAMGPADLFARHTMPVGEEAQGPRYAIERPLGAGAGGTVWAAHDHRLDRPVAIKVKARALSGTESAKALQGFLGEARIAASLRHPNVLAVHDLDVTEDGDPCFVMQRLDGMTLGDAMRAQREGRSVPAITNRNDVVSVFIAIGQALAYAHHHGVVHQDVKPDNVLLGNFGEVTLVDWGCAVRGRSAAGRLSGTPIYMAPEQARREGGDARSDVYALGGSLFHALVGRPALPPGDDSATFWLRKQRGDMDVLTPDETAVIPAELRAIMLKALAVDPDERYADAEAMVTDLRAYQAGLAVAAWRDSLWRVLVRWYRQHRTQTWTAAVALLLVAVAAGWVWREQARMHAVWQVVAEDDFSDAQRSDRWWRMLHLRSNWPDMDLIREVPLTANEPSAVIRNDALQMGAVKAVTNVVFRERFSGDLRVEWTVRSLDTAQNLNCFLGDDRVSGYTFHIGGWGDSTYCALTRGKDVVMLDQARLREPIAVNRDYHFRLERTGARLQLWMDDHRLFDYLDHDDERAMAPQSFGLDTWSGHSLAVQHVRIAVRSLPERVSPVAIGIALAHSGQHSEAVRSFDALAAAYNGAPIGVTAQFRSGFSRLRIDTQQAEGRARLEALAQTHPSHDLAPYAWFELMLHAQRGGDAEAVAHARRGLIAHADHPLCQRVLHDIGRERINSAPRDIELIEIAEAVAHELATWTQQYDQRPLGNAFFSQNAGHLLVHGRGDLVRAGLPPQHQFVARALLEAGHYDEVCQHWRHLTLEYAQACFQSGDTAALLAFATPYATGLAAIASDQPELARAPGIDSWMYAEVMMRRRAYAVVADDATLSPYPRAVAMAALGRHDEIETLGLEPHEQEYAMAKLLAGELDQVVKIASRVWSLRPLIGLAYWQRGDLDQARAAFAHPGLDTPDYTNAFDLVSCLTWRDLFHGDAERARTRWREWLPRLRHANGQRAWYILAYALGDVDAAGYQAQPNRREIAETWPLAQALRAELDGDVAAAQAAWAGLVDRLPQTDVSRWAWIYFAHWRAAQLAGPPLGS